MRDLLTKHRIPATNIVAATDFLNSADDSVIRAFIGEFGLNLNGSDAIAAARFAADAILRGAGAVDKVVGYVSKRMTGFAPKPAPAVSPVRIVGEAVVDTPEVIVAPVVEVRAEAVPVIKVKGKRGRPRLGNSDFCTAVKAIEAVGPKAERAALLAAVTSQASSKGGNIKQSSAVVYLWRYNNGERE
jgi:hypothetical protein